MYWQCGHIHAPWNASSSRSQGWWLAPSLHMPLQLAGVANRASFSHKGVTAGSIRRVPTLYVHGCACNSSVPHGHTMSTRLCPCQWFPHTVYVVVWTWAVAPAHTGKRAARLTGSMLLNDPCGLNSTTIYQLPQRVSCPRQRAMPVQLSRGPEQAQGRTSPTKNRCDKQVSS